MDQRGDPALSADEVLIGDGRVMLSRETCDRYLSLATSAVLLEREGRIYLVPLGGPSAGGLLLKQRNARGDRVLVATEFLAERGLGCFCPERPYAVRWVDEVGALLIEGLS